jgi:general secretion pathway protein H
VQSPFSSSVTLEGAQRRRGQAGFTFLELMIVLSIIAVAATLVAPAIESGIRAREVRSAVRGVAATLRTMKSDAVISGHVQHLIIDPRANELRVEDRADSYTLGSGTQITSVHGGELDPSGVVRVNFYPNGSTSGVEVLVDDREAPNDLGFVVSLDPLVGLVTIQDETR